MCGLLAGGSLIGWWLPTAVLDWQPGRAFEEPWRFLSAAWVHWSAQHLGANLAGVALVAALGVAARLPAACAMALVAAWPVTHAGLLLQPALAHYGGASGVLHAAVAVAAIWLIAAPAAGEFSRGGREDGGAEGNAGGSPGAGERRHRQERWIGAAIAAGLVAKVLLEAPWAGPVSPTRSWDIAVAPLAHASGALAGAVCAACAVGAIGVGARPPGGASRRG